MADNTDQNEHDDGIPPELRHLEREELIKRVMERVWELWRDELRHERERRQIRR